MKTIGRSRGDETPALGVVDRLIEDSRALRPTKKAKGQWWLAIRPDIDDEHVEWLDSAEQSWAEGFVEIFGGTVKPRSLGVAWERRFRKKFRWVDEPHEPMLWVIEAEEAEANDDMRGGFHCYEIRAPEGFPSKRDGDAPQDSNLH